MVHHTDRGLVHTSNESIRAKLKQRAPDKAQEVDGREFEFFKDVQQSIKYNVAVVKVSPYLDVQVLKHIYEVMHSSIVDVKF